MLTLKETSNQIRFLEWSLKNWENKRRKIKFETGYQEKAWRTSPRGRFWKYCTGADKSECRERPLQQKVAPQLPPGCLVDISPLYHKHCTCFVQQMTAVKFPTVSFFRALSLDRSWTQAICHWWFYSPPECEAWFMAPRWNWGRLLHNNTAIMGWTSWPGLGLREAPLPTTTECKGVMFCKTAITGSSLLLLIPSGWWNMEHMRKSSGLWCLALHWVNLPSSENSGYSCRFGLNGGQGAKSNVSLLWSWTSSAWFAAK